LGCGDIVCAQAEGVFSAAPGFLIGQHAFDALAFEAQAIVVVIKTLVQSPL
jgi:hypothetical protein